MLKGQFKICFTVGIGDQKASLKCSSSLCRILIPSEHCKCPFSYHKQQSIGAKCQRGCMVLQKLISSACSVPEVHYMRVERDLSLHCLKYSGAENGLVLLVKYCLLKGPIIFYPHIWRRGFSLVFSNI